MKKQILCLTLVLILGMTLIPAFAAMESHQLQLDVAIYREELAEELSEREMAVSESLDTEIPFWVDIVDADDLNDGEGVYIAVLDTGLLWQWPFFFPGTDIAWELGKGFTHEVWWDDGLKFGPLKDDRGYITNPFMGSGHGTHVVSTIVGYRYNTPSDLFWVKGVAPKATIIPVLVLDAWIVDTPLGPVGITGGTDEMVSAGIYYVAELAQTLDGPVIISMSLGGPEPAEMIEDAIDYAIGEGVIVVASAGNEGYDGMGWPGAYPQAISCGMAGWTEQWIGYPDLWWLNDVPEKLNTKDSWGNNWQVFLDYMSSRPNKKLGQKPFHLDVTTPGAAIVGPYKPYFSFALGYYYLWGTSMAAPHVSGIAAQVLQSHPHYDQDSMEHALKVAAAGTPLPSDGSWAYDVPGVEYYFEWYGIDWGKGFLQADEALKAAK